MNSLRQNRGLRIDLRPQNDPATAAGMRGVHRDMRGNVIGGYTAEGQPLGTKRRLPAGVADVLDGTARQPNFQIGAAPARGEPTVATPAAAKPPSYRLESIPGTGATRVIMDQPEMPAGSKEANPGTTRTKETSKSSFKLPSLVDALSAYAPSWMGKIWNAVSPKKSAQVEKPRINPLTGMRFGINPGDKGYEATWHNRYEQKATGAKTVAAPELMGPPAPKAVPAKPSALGDIASKAARTVSDVAGRAVDEATIGFRGLAPKLAAATSAVQAKLKVPPIDPRLTESVQQRRGRGYVPANSDEAALLEEMDQLNVDNARTREVWSYGRGHESRERNFEDKLRQWQSERDQIANAALDERSEVARFESQQKKEGYLRDHDAKVAKQREAFSKQTKLFDADYNQKRDSIGKRLKALGGTK